MYWVQNLSIPDITEKCGYEFGHKNFIKILRRFIPLRTTKEGLKFSSITKPVVIEDGFFDSGLHTTWDGKTVSYRSSYELDLCRELDAGRIPYLVEGITVDYYDSVLKKERFAIPDFYLPEQNLIIEVKSSFTFDKTNMLDKVAAYTAEGYDFILEYEHKSYSAKAMEEIEQSRMTVKQCKLEAKRCPVPAL